MKRSVSLVALIGALLTITEGWAVPCQPGTYDKYGQQDFSCTTGPLTLSKFKLEGDLVATNVMVKPLNMGLEFDFSLSVSAGMQRVDPKSATFSYEVMADAIHAASVLFDAVFSDPAAGGRSEVTKTFEGRAEELKVFRDSGTGFDGIRGPNEQSVILADLPMVLKVTETATVSQGATGRVRTTSISSVSDIFSTPEPASVTLLGLGILSLLGLRAWRRKRGNPLGLAIRFLSEKCQALLMKRIG